MLISKSYFYAQTNTHNLDKLRKQYCIQNCSVYTKEIILKSKKITNPPPPPFEDKSKFLKMFAIPKQKRLKLFPFTIYDSVYVTIPNIIGNVNEQTNYMDEKYHGYKELVTKRDKELISDVLFNYYKLNDLYHISTSMTNNVGCDCLEAEYPKAILLFYKNGKPLNFLSLHTYGNSTTNFKRAELKAFDLTDEKEEMILKQFANFIKQYGNKPCDTIRQTKEPMLIERKQQ